MSKYVQLQAQDGVKIPAWVAEPSSTVGARVGVVIAQEIFGVNAHIRAVAQQWAEQGMLAIAPELFARIAPDVQLGYDAAGVAQGKSLKEAVESLPQQGVIQDVRAAAQWLRDQGCEKVAVIGFCWGGLLAWRAAALVDQVDAAVCYYGGGTTIAPEISRHPRVPVLAHFGKRDAHIPLATVEVFCQAHPQVQVHLYEADHGFNCDQRGSYDAASAVQAKACTQAFLSQHFGQ